MTKIKIIFILLLLLPMSSCSGLYERGNRLTKLMYEEKPDLMANNFSKTDITSRYNNPNHRWKDRNGNEVYNYQYMAIKPFFHAYIPIVSLLFRPSQQINTYDISITFNKKGRIIDRSFSSKENKM